MTDTKTAEPSWTRGFLGSLLDRFFARQFALPAETSNYQVKELRIPVADGLTRFELAASLYQPILSNGAKVAGTVLVRCPYGRGLPISIGTARLFASRGYQVLFVSCRGTFGSGGEFDPFRTEVEDGKAVVEWMRKQDWYTGTFATIGMSYLGFTQWALLVDPPEDMVAAVISVGPHDFGKVHWETGALNMDIVGWANSVAHQEEPYYMLRQIVKEKLGLGFRPVLDSVPIVQSVEAALQGKVPWLKSKMTNSDLTDPHWTPMNLDRALERANIPILLISGWYDLFLEQSIEQYLRLHERGCNVAMTMGAWTHMSSGFNNITNKQTFEWLEEYLAKKGKVERQAPMQYYVTGVDEWRHTSDFPPPNKEQALHLQAGNKLSIGSPATETTSTEFVFDPHNPTPTYGGNPLQDAGSVDDTALAHRSDVLTFTTEPLEQDLEMVGRPLVELNHSTDIAYADLFVRISEVDEKGKSHNITDTLKRLDPERTTNVVRLPLHWCAHRFVKGKRVRLIVAGGSHPHYARNLGTKNPDNTGSEMKAVKHTVFQGGAQDSKVVLPVPVQ